MSEEISPFGAENLPFRELEKQGQQTQDETKLKSKNKFLVMALMTIIIFLLLIIILLLLSKTSPSVPFVVPSPSVVLVSPAPVATETALPKSVGTRLDELEKKLKEVDLYQTEFSFPNLDFSFNFGKER